MSAPVYADYNATTPLDPEVHGAMEPFLTRHFGNPSSGHAFGRACATAVEEARGQVAELIGVGAEEIVFTSGGTESNNLALLGRGGISRLVVSAVEHPSVEGPASELESRGVTCDRIPVSDRGALDLDVAGELLRRPASMVSVMLAQNETGVVFPVGQIARLARQGHPDVVVHTDAAQAVGKIPVDVAALDVDLLTIVGHKLYGPKGIGALFVREGVALSPRTFGGGQERGLRPGTEPVALIVGLGAACARAQALLARESEQLAALREALWAGLSHRVPGVVRTGAGEPVLPGTLHVRFPGCEGRAVLDQAEAVAASTGSACHADSATVSGVLGAMGLSVDAARGAVRLSLGRFSTKEDVDRIVGALADAHARIGG